MRIFYFETRFSMKFLWNFASFFVLLILKLEVEKKFSNQALMVWSIQPHNPSSFQKKIITFFFGKINFGKFSPSRKMEFMETFFQSTPLVSDQSNFFFFAYVGWDQKEFKNFFFKPRIFNNNNNKLRDKNW